MLKIGTIVTIRPDLEDGLGYGKDIANDSMVELCGRRAVITYVRPSGSYRIDLDGGRWNWTDEMFVDIENKSPYQKWENKMLTSVNQSVNL